MTERALTVAASRRLREITLSVDLRFTAGVTAIVGPSGAGKSTLLRLVAGLMHPDAGTIRLGDRVLDDAVARRFVAPGRRNISLVFQEYALFPHLSVGANVGYGLAARGVRRRERARRVGEILERLAIDELARERPGRLSGGQRQRVALARALVLQPDALLLDEPLAALDVQTRTSVRRELRTALATLAIPSLLVTHDYADALVFRERIVILSEGRVVQDGAHSDLLAHPRSRFVADFTGINFFEGRIEGYESPGVARIRVGDDLAIVATVEDLALGPVGVGLHPWEVTLSALPPEGSARNVYAARVREVLPFGGRVRVTLGIGTLFRHTLVAEISAGALDTLPCHEGAALHAAFKATALSVAASG